MHFPADPRLTGDDGRVSGARPPPGLSRRGLLVGGVVAGAVVAGALGVEEDVLPGRRWLHRALGLDGPDGAVPDVRPGPLTSGSFVSPARLGQRVGWSIGLPPDPGENLPVAVVLHGRGGDHTSAFAPDYLALGSFLAAAVAAGTPPFALASVDGGEAYWHPRANGDDPQRMVLEEFLPLLGRHGLDTRRLAFLGWSMGGFGSLHLAGTLGAERVAGVAVMSPALWHEYADTAPGAYDDARDFAAVEVMTRRSDLDGIALRVDCGEEDPFYASTRDYVEGFAERPAGGFEPGDHDIGYWRRMAPQEVGFLGRALHA